MAIRRRAQFQLHLQRRSRRRKPGRARTRRAISAPRQRPEGRQADPRLGQMVEAETGDHLWTERFDRPLDDIFALQDEIALNVVGAIEPSLRRAEVERVKRKRPDSLDAYDLVLQSQADVNSGMPAQVTKALVLFHRALAIDPTYALAHAIAAMCHHCLYLRGGLHEEIDGLDPLRRAAIPHGHDDALALTFAGFSIGMDGHDHAAAFMALEAALAISPSSALTYILGSVMLAWGGEAERAIEWSERGMRLSPLDPWEFAAYDAQAMGHFCLGRYDKAAHAAYKSVQANPAHSITYVQLAAALAKLGTAGRSQIGCGQSLGAASNISIQPPICRRQLRICASRSDE